MSPAMSQGKTGSTIRAARFAAHLSIPDVPEPHFAYNATKRLIDIFGSVFLIILSLPIVLLAALLIKLESKGEVIFRHRRFGLKGKPFFCYKLRTMYHDAYHRRHEIKSALGLSGPRIKSPQDPRITRVGRLLRRFSIDEFPQLFNVIRGDMSLVGPRPLPIEELETCSLEEIQRLAVKPGLTCIWQVSGRSEVPLEKHVQMDLEYIAKRSLWLDLWLIARTPRAVISGRGAY